MTHNLKIKKQPSDITVISLKFSTWIQTNDIQLGYEPDPQNLES